ncbi:MAG: tRNA (adenosine(37)-N6)-threonylcarbamoyltransferase complex transferase subunit TsaD [Traorella sp.]
MSKILAIESSCDETAAAIIQDEHIILSNVVATQIDVHKQYGGVIPEIASRIHIENISMVIDECLKKAKLTIEDVDAIAFTQGPGLIGSLHVGVQAAKTLAWAFNKPLVPVHHIAGHIYANRLVCELKFPLLALVVSGGHTELVYMEDEWSFEVLGSTQDDAIGEAFDKVGRVLGLPYPGGVYIDKIAKNGKNIYKLPKPKPENELDFSFSGLKSGVLQFIKRMERNNETFKPEDLACSFQETAISTLLERADIALSKYPVKQFVLAGGVAANSCLRHHVLHDLQNKYPQVECIIPPLSCCTDNAAMIGVAGSVAYRHGVRGNFDLSAQPSFDLESSVR